jgi:hypothetical protein
VVETNIFVLHMLPLWSSNACYKSPTAHIFRYLSWNAGDGSAMKSKHARIGTGKQVSEE